MALNVEGVVGGRVKGQEALGSPRTFEPLHLALPSSGWLMRVLRSVVTPPPTFMAVGDSKITTGRPVRPQIVGHQLVRHKIHFLQQFPHQFQCSPLVPLALHENVEHLALGINGTPQIDRTPINLDVHLVKMPCGMRLGAALAEIGCNHRPKWFTQRRTVS